MSFVWRCKHHGSFRWVGSSFYLCQPANQPLCPQVSYRGVVSNPAALYSPQHGWAAGFPVWELPGAEPHQGAAQTAPGPQWTGGRRWTQGWCYDTDVCVHWFVSVFKNRIPFLTLILVSVFKLCISWCLNNLCLLVQECLEKFLQGTGGLQNRELLMVHYLQQANYIPALQLNHSLRVNLVVCRVHMCYHVFLLINTLSPCFLCKFLIHIFFKTRVFTQGIFTLSFLYITSHLHINTPTPLVSDCTQTCFSTSPLHHFFFYF